MVKFITGSAKREKKVIRPVLTLPFFPSQIKQRGPADLVVVVVVHFWCTFLARLSAVMLTALACLTRVTCCWWTLQAPTKKVQPSQMRWSFIRWLLLCMYEYCCYSQCGPRWSFRKNSEIYDTRDSFVAGVWWISWRVIMAQYSRWLW